MISYIGAVVENCSTGLRVRASEMVSAARGETQCFIF